MSSAQQSFNVAMLGCGVVGSEVARLLLADDGDFAARSGAKLNLTRIAVRDSKAGRERIPKELLTQDAESVVSDPLVDIVIEVMGGIEPARTLILKAISNGKSIITANSHLSAKALIDELMNQVDVWLEGKHNPDDITIVIIKHNK